MSAGKNLLVVLDIAVGSTTAQVRGRRFESRFREAGWTADFVDFSDATVDEIVERAKSASVVYLVKVRSLVLLREIKRRTSAKVVFDLTDALWQGSNRSAWSDIELIVAEADVIFSENTYVCDFAKRLNPRVVSIPVCTLVEQFAETRAREPELLVRDSTVTIGWIGSPLTTTALTRIRPVLESLSTGHPNVVFRFLGVGPMEFDGWNARITAVPTYDEQRMVREILMMDIGLYPPPRDLEEYAIRGAQKAMLYMTGGAVPLAQDAGDCARVIRHGETGMLADDAKSWRDCLEVLVASQERRTRMAEAARHAMAPYSIKAVFDKLESSLIAARDTPRRRVSRSIALQARTEKRVRDVLYAASALGTRLRRRLARMRSGGSLR